MASNNILNTGAAATAAANSWDMLSIPFNAWLGSTGSFQANNTFDLQYMVPFTARDGGSPVSPSASMDFGTVTFNIIGPGTYNFFFIYNQATDAGILKFDIDSGTLVKEVDMYDGTPIETSVSWTMSLAAGLHTIHMYCDSKNIGSSNYWLLPVSPCLNISRIS